MVDLGVLRVVQNRRIRCELTGSPEWRYKRPIGGDRQHQISLEEDFITVGYKSPPALLHMAARSKSIVDDYDMCSNYGGAKQRLYEPINC